MKNSVLGQNHPISSPIIPPTPIYYRVEDVFKDRLEFIHKIRHEAEPYENWFGVSKFDFERKNIHPFRTHIDWAL